MPVMMQSVLDEEDAELHGTRRNGNLECWHWTWMPRAYEGRGIGNRRNLGRGALVFGSLECGAGQGQGMVQV